MNEEKIPLSQVPTNNPVKTVAGILKVNKDQKKNILNGNIIGEKEARSLKFYFPLDQDPKERVKGPRKHVKRLSKQRFNSLQTIR